MGYAMVVGAVGFSMLTVVLNVVCVPMLLNMLSEMKVEHDVVMGEFKLVSDQVYSQMAVLRLKIGAPDRSLRQSGFQGWDQSAGVTGFGSQTASASDSSCPAGPPGEPGQDGNPGIDGIPGMDGEPGADGTSFGAEIDDDGCIVCPQGPQGPSGPPGPPGAPGQKGWPGTDGNPGSDGWPGPVGPRGFKGQEGISGEAGPKGPPGKPAPGGKGEPGPKGARGPIGRAGSQGSSGKPGYKAGPPGPEGKEGPKGTDGKPGTDGVEGRRGDAGVPGGDAKYCPCPKEIFRTTPQFAAEPQPTFNPGWGGPPGEQWTGSTWASAPGWPAKK